jgi:hypothetical protein
MFPCGLAHAPVATEASWKSAASGLADGIVAVAEACETANRFRERDVAAREANPYNGEASLQRAHPDFAADDRRASGPNDSPVRAVAVRSPLVSVKSGAANILAAQAVILDTKTVDQRTMHLGTMDKTGQPRARLATQL